jgi:cell wall-associated NlpC family hydrolase
LISDHSSAKPASKISDAEKQLIALSRRLQQVDENECYMPVRFLHDDDELETPHYSVTARSSGVPAAVTELFQERRNRSKSAHASPQKVHSPNKRKRKKKTTSKANSAVSSLQADVAADKHVQQVAGKQEKKASSKSRSSLSVIDNVTGACRVDAVKQRIPRRLDLESVVTADFLQSIGVCEANEQTIDRKWAKYRAMSRSDTKRMQLLRQRFLLRALKYIGIPYSEKYHTDTSSIYHGSPLFLDCCGLVRRVLWDMRDDFGFRFGPYNQSYQFDTLPLRKKSIEELQPGDLIFYSGEYYQSNMENHPHNMVHVEIFLGGSTGEQTLGARYQRGVVQVHDSYRFTSQSYHSVQHYFCSIDTWLRGICECICKDHDYAEMARRKAVLAAARKKGIRALGAIVGVGVRPVAAQTAPAQQPLGNEHAELRMLRHCGLMEMLECDAMSAEDENVDVLEESSEVSEGEEDFM